MIARSCGSISAVFCNGSFHSNWHIEHIAGKLDACRQGKDQAAYNQCSSAQPKIGGRLDRAAGWWLGHDPSAQIIAVSYAQDPSDKLARDCRTLMQSTWYQSLFATRLSSERKAVGEFVTTKAARGWRLRPQGTGRGADVIII